MVLTIPTWIGWFHRYNGRLCRRTQTRILDKTIVFASNSGNHGVMKRPVDPENHGPSHNMMYLASVEGKFTLESPLE